MEIPTATCVASIWASLFPCYQSITFGSVLMFISSMIPVFVPLLILIRLVWKRETSMLLALVFLGLVMLICEGILKHTVKQARPVGSCDCSYGMPSSHSATSFGFLTWIFLEIGFPLTVVDRNANLRGWNNPQNRKLVYLIIATIAFVPVPFSRVYFLYHSIAQVIVGIVVGSILALTWFGILRGLVVPKAYLDKLVNLKLFRMVRAINDYRPRIQQAVDSGDMEEMGSWDPSSRV